jgi:hypothetical protein
MLEFGCAAMRRLKSSRGGVATMAHSQPFPMTLAAERAESIPWYIWCAVAAVTSAMIGGHWDISWHRSIGRDTFWTPAHIAIYLCGILAGVSCAYLILATTWGKLPDVAAASVSMWGFRGPLGAFISAWGGVAMLTSAPFDDWWHKAYGLDVKILSPPHVALIMGVLAIEAGTLILILGYMNRVSGELQKKLNLLFLYIGAMMLVLLAVMVLEWTDRVLMHTGTFYRVVAMAIPAVLAGVARASDLRWSATIAACIYTLFLCLLVWILPLFPAEPKLGPVYYQVTHFVPPYFPMLLIVPAFVLDFFWAKTKAWNAWLWAAASGFIFLTTFFVAQWNFADFLMSPASRNAFFATNDFDYLTSPSSSMFQNRYWNLEKTPTEFRNQLWLALAIAMVNMRLGLAWGNWMRKVRR